MLPFTKRTARDDGEVINTAEIEVLRSNSRGLHPVRPQASSSRSGRSPSHPTSPVRATRATQPSVSDEEMTRLVPRSTAPASSRAGLRRVPHKAARAAKPTTPAISPDSIPPMALAVTTPGAAGTVITNRPRVQGRPTAIWTVALVAMGLFAGLASSVVARGDADSIIDATASFVDPARAGGTRAAPPVAAAQVAIAPIAAPIPTPAPVAPIIGYVPASSNPQPTTTVAAADLPAASVTASRDRLPPVAYAAAAAAKPLVAVKPVTARRTPRWSAPAPKVATNNAAASSEAKATDDAKDTKDVKVAAVAEAPAPKATKGPRGKHHSASDEDLASASAADELARAQLEAALR